MDNILFEHRKNNNCLDDTLTVLLDFDGISSQYIYSYSWHLRYERKGPLNSIGKFIDVGWINPWRALEDFVGYEFYSCPSYRREEFTKILHEISEKKRPVILNCDSFNADWTRNFHNYHTQHFCLIVDFDNEKLRIIDPLMSEIIEETSLDSIIGSPCKLIVSNVESVNPVDADKLLPFIRPNALAEGEKQYIDSLELLINDLREINKNKGDLPTTTFVQLENHKDSLMNVAKLMEFAGDKRIKDEFYLFKNTSELWKKYIRCVLDKKEYVMQDELLTSVLAGERDLIKDICLNV